MKFCMERFVALRFSLGCTSQSSVAVTQSEINPTKSKTSQGSSYNEKNKSFSFLALPRLKIHRWIRSIRNFARLLVYQEEMEEEMEIGFPTDVKHVTHIGLDGSRITNHVKGWEKMKAPEIISFPSISLKQFELAMAAQVHANLTT